MSIQFWLDTSWFCRKKFLKSSSLSYTATLALQNFQCRWCNCKENISVDIIRKYENIRGSNYSNEVQKKKKKLLSEFSEKYLMC